MNLIVGGAGQGKLAYALEMTGLDRGNVSSQIGDAPLILTRLEAWLRTETDPWPALEVLLERQPEVTILCREVGCGVVPMDRDERAWRELVGRICCELAEQAAAVYRVCCGLGAQLK